MKTKTQAIIPPLSPAVMFRLAEAMHMNRVEKAIPGGLLVQYECRLCKERSRGIADEIAHAETCPLNRLK